MLRWMSGVTREKIESGTSYKDLGNCINDLIMNEIR